MATSGVTLSWRSDLGQITDIDELLERLRAHGAARSVAAESVFDVAHSISGICSTSANDVLWRIRLLPSPFRFGRSVHSRCPTGFPMNCADRLSHTLHHQFRVEVPFNARSTIDLPHLHEPPAWREPPLLMPAPDIGPRDIAILPLFGYGSRTRVHRRRDHLEIEVRAPLRTVTCGRRQLTSWDNAVQA